MRLTTIRSVDGLRVGMLDGDRLRVLEPGTSMLDIVRGGDEAVSDVVRRARTADVVELDTVVHGPLLDPPTVRDFLTYERHLAELAGSVPDEWYDKPLFYFSNPGSIFGAYDDVPIPPLVEQYDYECEIAAVVGRRGSDLTPARAQEHIFGYTIMNDWSARDLQVHEFKFPMGPSKSKDGAITLGPWLVTADEFADHIADGRLALTTSVHLNGARVGGDNSANMAWSFAELVAFASRGAQVRPGDVVGSGTCGTGCLAEIKRSGGDSAPGWLTPGDVVRLDVEGLGHTENTLTEGAAPVDIPAGRRRIGVAATDTMTNGES